MIIRSAVLASAALLAMPAAAQQAQVDLDALEACARGDGTPADCIAEALSPCDSVLPETPAVAVLCYENASAVWEAAIPPEIEALQAAGDPVTASQAAVNARFDVLTGRLECDRREQLALIADAPPDEIPRDKARCTASVPAVTWLRLRLTPRE